MNNTTKEAIRCVALVALTAAEVVIALYPLAKYLYTEKKIAGDAKKPFFSGYAEGFLTSTAIFGATCDAIAKLRKNI